MTQLKKETIVNEIAQRIKDEHRKHKQIDWAMIAAKKIYSSYIDDKPDTPDTPFTFDKNKSIFY